MEGEFPLWLRLAHYLNFLFLTLLVRSGLEILSAHPKLYWNDDARPGSEWLKLSRKTMPPGAEWTSTDEATRFPAWLALPGGGHLGLGRHWHFMIVAGWVLTGLIYVVMLLVSHQWTRLIPTSWEVLPRAWEAALSYLRLGIPPDGHPYNALQQLTYAGVVFLLAPWLILTGLAMSPALQGRFGFTDRVFGGHQRARSLHFLGLVAFVAFTVVHVGMVVAHGFVREMGAIALGAAGHADTVPAVAAGFAVVLAVNVLATSGSLGRPAETKRLLEIGIDGARRWLFHRWVSRQHHNHRSPYFRVNGRPPHDATWRRLAEGHFAAWRLEVTGQVEHPMGLSLAELEALPRSVQTTRHVCIQGWTAYAQWGGVALSEILDRCRPLPTARYVVFHTYDDKWEYPGSGYYYEVIDLDMARRPQTILAFEMNGGPLPVPHGAPLRLRLEGQLGYKMAKWLRGIELVEDFRHLGRGQGGWRDDVLDYYPGDAGL